jgi:hypothetical protein
MPLEASNESWLAPESVSVPKVNTQNASSATNIATGTSETNTGGMGQASETRFLFDMLHIIASFPPCSCPRHNQACDCKKSAVPAVQEKRKRHERRRRNRGRNRRAKIYLPPLEHFSNQPTSFIL